MNQELEPTRKALEEARNVLETKPLNDNDERVLRQKVMIMRATLDSARDFAEFPDKETKRLIEVAKDLTQLEEQIKILEEENING